MNGMTMEIFSYSELRNNAQREINRLQRSETELDKQSSIDHALNAAFSIYHLIQWRHNEENPHAKIIIKAHDFIQKTDNEGLQLLHDIVTKQKHVTVSQKTRPDEENKPLVYDNIINITTEDGVHLTTENDQPIVTEDSYIEVRFWDHRAMNILNDAMSEFSTK